MAKIVDQNLVAYGCFNGMYPVDKPKSLQVDLDFSAATSYDIELELAIETGRLPFVQGVFIDNSKNAALTLTLTAFPNGQRIVCPGGKQVFAPLFAGGTKFNATLSGAGSADTHIWLVNFPMPIGQIG